MRNLYVSLFIAIFSIVAGATETISGKFEVGTYTICNGRPVSKGDVSPCSNFNYWGSVRLVELSSIDLSITGSEKVIRLEDKSGKVWQQDLKFCDKPPHALRGCSHEITWVSPQEILLKVNQWGAGEPTVRLRLKIKNENKVTLSGQIGDRFEFDIKKVGPPEFAQRDIFRGSCVPNHCYSMMNCNGSRWPSSFKSSCDSSYESYCNYRGECEGL